ncbi:MAG: NAD(P)-binding domain-containing protein [Bacteroidales bacterium]|nr:NAD(P)-binding domain-containing protein [Bacteroidales bacterium]
MFKILTAEPTHKILQESLENAEFICEYLPKLSFTELKSIIPEYDGLVIRSKFKIDKDFIDTAKKLKFIARAGAGMENIDTGYAESKGIKCINSPEGNRDSVGEHALGMLLTLFHKINIADKEIRRGIWNRQYIGTEIQGKTIGIIGYGNMGSAFAQKLKGFSVNVIAYDKYKTGFSDDFVKEVSLKTLFSKTDIFSIHIPLTDETHFLINNEFLKKFQKPIYIINTARGKVLKTDDLVKNMKSGKILGACLDVSEYEKTSFTDIFAGKNSASLQYLINSDKVIMTPHIAGSSENSYKKIAGVLAEKIIHNFKLQ